MVGVSGGSNKKRGINKSSEPMEQEVFTKCITQKSNAPDTSSLNQKQDAKENPNNVNGNQNSVLSSTAEKARVEQIEKRDQSVETTFTKRTVDGFFDEILQYMNVMNVRQKICFRSRVLQSLHEVCDDNTDFPKETDVQASSNDNLLAVFANLTVEELNLIRKFASLVNERPQSPEDVTAAIGNPVTLSSPEHLPETSPEHSPVREAVPLVERNVGNRGYMVSAINGNSNQRVYRIVNNAQNNGVTTANNNVAPRGKTPPVSPRPVQKRLGTVAEPEVPPKVVRPIIGTRKKAIASVGPNETVTVSISGNLTNNKNRASPDRGRAMTRTSIAISPNSKPMTKSSKQNVRRISISTSPTSTTMQNNSGVQQRMVSSNGNAVNAQQRARYSPPRKINHAAQVNMPTTFRSTSPIETLINFSINGNKLPSSVGIGSGARFANVVGNGSAEAVGIARSGIYPWTKIVGTQGSDQEEIQKKQKQQQQAQQQQYQQHLQRQLQQQQLQQQRLQQLRQQQQRQLQLQQHKRLQQQQQHEQQKQQEEQQPLLQLQQEQTRQPEQEQKQTPESGIKQEIEDILGM